MTIDGLIEKTVARDELRSLRPVVMGTEHMVVAGHYLAAQAGMQILEEGGNAVDAGVATGLALGVVQSDLVSVAGVAPIILFLADQQEVVTISGLGVWPQAASVDLFRREHGGRIPEGLLRTVVPSAPDAWITALEKFGRMSFGQVARSALRFASHGFPMHSFMSNRISEAEADYRRWESSAKVFLPDGRPPAPGEIFIQNDLGAVLQYMVEEERSASRRGRQAGLQAARNAFYRGDIAVRIVQYHRENGGLLTAQDLSNFRVRIEPSEQITFRDTEIHACGPWCQGPTLLQTLRLLEACDLKSLGHNSASYVHILTEALKLAFADREQFYGDPLHVEVPMAELLSERNANQRKGLIRSDQAWVEMPPPSRLGAAGKSPPDSSRGLGKPPGEAGNPKRPGWDTSYVCVVDRDGNAFSATPSDVSYDTPIIPGTGLAVSSRGSQSRVDPSHPACLAPGKRPRLTPNPALALRNGGLFMPIGTPGGDVQPQAMLQVLLNILVFGMNPQQAVEAPRFASYSFPSSFAPHSCYPGLLKIESRVRREMGVELEELGHRVSWWPGWSWRAGGVCTIMVDQARGVLQGGADPRRPGYAVGW